MNDLLRNETHYIITMETEGVHPTVNLTAKFQDEVSCLGKQVNSTETRINSTMNLLSFFFKLLLLQLQQEIYHIINNYRPPTKMREGNVFTVVCQSFCLQWMVVCRGLGMWSRGCGMWRGYGLHPSGTLFYLLQQSWGNVMFFTRVCDSVHRGGGLPYCMLWYTPLSRPPPGADSPWEQTPPGSRHPGSRRTPSGVHAERYGQQTGGMHPTGMQSCC